MRSHNGSIDTTHTHSLLSFYDTFKLVFCSLKIKIEQAVRRGFLIRRESCSPNCIGDDVQWTTYMTKEGLKGGFCLPTTVFVKDLSIHCTLQYTHVQKPHCRGREGGRTDTFRQMKPWIALYTVPLSCPPSLYLFTGCEGWGDVCMYLSPRSMQR